MAARRSNRRVGPLGGRPDLSARFTARGAALLRVRATGDGDLTPAVGPQWRIICCALLVLAASVPGVAQIVTPTDADNSRIVHEFDFNERPLGNFDPLPMHWEPWVAPGFPSHNDAHLDESVGRITKASFHIPANGRNAAYWYRGPNTLAKPNSTHVLVGWVRPDRLVGARACLSAYYVDAAGLPLAETQRFGPLIGGAGDSGDWTQVEIHLPPCPPPGRSIGVTAWIVQPQVWDTAPRPHRHIETVDVVGGAWFDDFTIYVVPNVGLRSAEPGNVFVAPKVPVLLATVMDNDPAGLEATLTITNAKGAIVRTMSIQPTDRPEDAETPIHLGGMRAGLYEATLRVRYGVEGASVVRMRFIQVAAPTEPMFGPFPSFGVAIDAARPGSAEAVDSLLGALRVGQAKMPVWSPSPRFGDSDTSLQELNALITRLLERRVLLTAVLAAPPAELVQTAGRYARTLIEILSDDPKGWGPYLTPVAANYASVFRSWQIGRDGDTAIMQDAGLASAIERTRVELHPVIPTVSMNAVIPVGSDGAASSQADSLTVYVPPELGDEWIAEYLRGVAGNSDRRLSAFVDYDLEAQSQFARLPALGSFCLRVLRTRHAGIDTVFVPQLWRYGGDHGNQVAPTDATVVFRTIVDQVRDLVPGPMIDVVPGVKAMSFLDAGQALLVIWAPKAPPEGIEFAFGLQGAREAVDLFGNRTEIVAEAGDRPKMKAYQHPTYVTGVERWIVDLFATTRLEPERIESNILPAKVALRIDASVSHAVGGNIELVTPPGWEIRPDRFGFLLQPNQAFEQQLTVRNPPNEPAGTTQIHARFQFDDRTTEAMSVPLKLTLELAGIDVFGYAFGEGSRLIVTHTITNRTDETISFQSEAVAQGRGRQFRVIPSLAPGVSVTNEFRFSDADSLSDRRIRLTLREINGPRKHIIELTAP